VGAALHQREEHECEVSPRSFPADWPESPARDIVTRLSDGRPLTELLSFRQLRTNRAVDCGDRAVGELSLDTVDVDINGHRTRTLELEIELGPSGITSDLDALDAELRPYELIAQSTSKFERALAMLDQSAGRPASRKKKEKKKTPGVRADEPMAEAGRKILRFHFKRMLANEEGARKGDDIEALHRMRVAIRRQRGAFRIVRPYFKRKAVRAFRDELRTLAEHLGDVRDLDVLIEAAVGYQASLKHDAGAALDPLRALLADQPCLCGGAPAYADYIVFGAFQWARSVSPAKLLAADDPVHAWRERLLDLHGGLARRAKGYPA